jgi:tRNA(fMet)-specific endonuclease VapC
MKTDWEPLQFADIQIATIAIANDLTLVTGNISHFERIFGLHTQNWIG